MDQFNPDEYLKSSTPVADSSAPEGFNPDKYLKEAEFGTTGQLLASTAEGIAQGVAGPVAPAVEIATGITTPERIRARQEVNPVSHGAGEIAGFLGSALSGLGIAPAIETVGKAAAKIAPEALPKLAAAGIKTGAEMAALQTSDELSKVITQDPGQTVGSAAINIGLSGLMGGVGGAALGAASPFFEKSAEKVANAIDSAKLQYALKKGAPEVEEALTRKTVFDPFTKTDTGIPLSETPRAKQTNIDPFTKLESVPKESPIEEATPSLDKTGIKLGDLASAIADKTNNPMEALIGLGELLHGHPLIGAAVLGKKYVGSMAASMLKPMLENATDSFAARGGFDYLANAIRGQNLLGEATRNIFEAGAKIIPQQLIPDQASRDQLNNKLDQVQSNPQSLIDSGNKLGHYLPDHASAATSIVGSAAAYLNSIKPRSIQPVSLDSNLPVSQAATNNYNRQLDIAQQPLLVLQHLKNGSLLPQDIATLNAVYPDLHKSMINKVSQQLIKVKAAGKNVPYQKRMSLSMFLGQPLDSTITQPLMQASMAANAPKGPVEPQGKTKKPSKPSMAQQQKLNDMYATKSQSRESNDKA